VFWRYFLTRRSMWLTARSCTLTPGQSEIKIDFPLPIAASNIIIEFADFYDNLQGGSEMLQCPRCQASVPAHPGVCGTCGENVYQCHKCRAINYDEKDPFLCNSCGFSKYAKFEISMEARSCSTVDPIESEEDRQKTLTGISTLLDRADQVYKLLVQRHNELDQILILLYACCTKNSAHSWLCYIESSLLIYSDNYMRLTDHTFYHWRGRWQSSVSPGSLSYCYSSTSAISSSV